MQIRALYRTEAQHSACLPCLLPEFGCHPPPNFLQIHPHASDGGLQREHLTFVSLGAADDGSTTPANCSRSGGFSSSASFRGHAIERAWIHAKQDGPRRPQNRTLSQLILPGSMSNRGKTPGGCRVRLRAVRGSG
jgi:hypothetical protein